MTQTEFTISEHLLPVLARLAGEDSWPLSPWAQVEPIEEIGPEAWQVLEEAGFVEAGGDTLNEEAREVLALLREPSSFVRVRLLNGPLLIEHIIYCCGPEQERVSLSTSSTGLMINHPAPLDQFLINLLEFWGDSSLVGTRLKLELEHAPALVFAALVDLRRRENLGSWAAGQDAGPREYSRAEIRQSLEANSREGQWLVTSISAFCQWERTLTDQAQEDALSRLMECGVVDRGASGFRLAGDGLAFADIFPIISQVLRFEAGSQLADSTVARSTMLCLQAGVHDNVSLEVDNGRLLMETVSAHFITAMVDTFLVDPARVLALAPSPAEPKAAAGDETPPQTVPEPGPDSAPEPEQPVLWYLYRQQEQYGPYSQEQMVNFIEEGRVDPSDLVWNASLEEWTQADTVPGLFVAQEPMSRSGEAPMADGAGRKVPSNARCSGCGREVEPQAIFCGGCGRKLADD